jgi:hypothetical protein
MTTPAWTAIGSAVTGTSHELVGRGCEDSFGWQVGDGRVAMAVADGAGSRSHSDLGSHAAVSAILEWAHTSEPSADGSGLVHGFEQVREALRQLAGRTSCEFDDLATTLGVVVVGPEVVEVGQIGDTIIVLLLDDGSLVMSSPPETFEYVNETVFVTADSALSHLRVDTFPATSVQAAALSTDGLRFKILGDLATHEPYAPFFDDIFNYARTDGSNNAAVGRFLSGLDDQSGDDKTLVIGVRGPVGALDPGRPAGPAVIGPERALTGADLPVHESGPN